CSRESSGSSIASRPVTPTENKPSRNATRETNGGWSGPCRCVPIPCCPSSILKRTRRRRSRAPTTISRGSERRSSGRPMLHRGPILEKRFDDDWFIEYRHHLLKSSAFAFRERQPHIVHNIIHSARLGGRVDRHIDR